MPSAPPPAVRDRVAREGAPRPARPLPERRSIPWHATTRARRVVAGELLWLGVLTVAVLVVTAGAIGLQGGFPVSTYVLPLALATLVIGPARLPWFVVGSLAALSLAVALQDSITTRTGVSVGVVFVYGLVILLSSFRRTRLGVSGLRGESMLVDLRDRIIDQGRLPALPAGWLAESEMRSAGGTPFAGDFVVATGTAAGDRLDVAVVDVSGKGEAAGTRALMLSGALGGLLGALRPEDLLPAANEYLLRQQWEEGFATAVHLTADLRSGDFEVRSAGHPPALWFRAGSGRWRALDAEGPVLGVVQGAEFTVSRGTLSRGDALLLYTDGLVESSRRDLARGIDRLGGHAERLLAHGFEGAAARLVEQLGSRSDDRALLLLHRR